ncbi:hypothetical protein BWI96_06815 [Siphonobacter sp. SORGH_AS_0500]|nr:hypothetical protein BWI96_06815 [Siphonobacter sp. SORGH_AS_0500]
MVLINLATVLHEERLVGKILTWGIYIFMQGKLRKRLNILMLVTKSLAETTEIELKQPLKNVWR